MSRLKIPNSVDGSALSWEILSQFDAAHGLARADAVARPCRRILGRRSLPVGRQRSWLVPDLGRPLSGAVALVRYYAVEEVSHTDQCAAARGPATRQHRAGRRRGADGE